MTASMLRQLRHDVWATEQLAGRLRTLTPEQLRLSIPGTYGPVLRTLQHIVSSDEGYLVRLLGTVFHDPAFRAEPDASLDEVAAHLAHVKDGVERLFKVSEPDGERLIRDTPLRRPDQSRFEMFAWVPLTLFVHHGNDHRAQICTTLSTHGIEPPDLQVWPYAMALNASRQVE